MQTDTLTFEDVIESFERETEKHKLALRANPMHVSTAPVPADNVNPPAPPSKPRRRQPPKKLRGIFEHPKGSGVWWIHYYDASGCRRREKAGTRGMAETLLTTRRNEKLQGKLPDTIRSSRRKAVLFRDLAEDAVIYAREHHQSERERDYRAGLLIELFGNRPARAITPQEIDRELSKVAREREWKPASYNRFKAFVSLVYRLGIENDKVTVNPARLVRRRREDNGVIRWLTADEEKKLRAVIEANYPGELPAFDLGLHTGMRRSEHYRLAWERVDLERRQITIPRSKHGGIRYIPLDNTAMNALLALRRRGNGSGPVMVLAEAGHGYDKGHALTTPKEWFMAAVAKAGIADFTWHCLRHTFASRLVMAGVSLRKVQELMGHKTIAMTCRYAHLSPEHLQDAVSKLDNWGLNPIAGPGKAFEPGRAEDECAAVTADVKKDDRAVSGVPTATRTATSDSEGSWNGAAVANQVLVQ